MYWILSNELADEDHDADLSGSFSTDVGADIDFDEGEEVSLPITKATYTLSEPVRGNLTDHMSIDEVPGLVVSGRLQDLLHNLMIDNMQYFDLEIVDFASDRPLKGYKIANIIGTVDCINRDASDLVYFDDGDVKFINKLVLDEDRIPPEACIFRLEGNTTMVLLNQSVKGAIVDAQMTGCVFYKPENCR